MQQAVGGKGSRPGEAHHMGTASSSDAPNLDLSQQMHGWLRLLLCHILDQLTQVTRPAAEHGLRHAQSPVTAAGCIYQRRAAACRNGRATSACGWPRTAACVSCARAAASSCASGSPRCRRASQPRCCKPPPSTPGVFSGCPHSRAGTALYLLSRLRSGMHD